MDASGFKDEAPPAPASVDTLVMENVFHCPTVRDEDSGHYMYIHSQEVSLLDSMFRLNKRHTPQPEKHLFLYDFQNHVKMFFAFFPGDAKPISFLSN